MENLLNRLIDLAVACPDKKAVIFKEECLTYRELCRRIAGMAELLVRGGGVSLWRQGMFFRRVEAGDGGSLYGDPSVRRSSGISRQKWHAGEYGGNLRRCRGEAAAYG